MARNSNVKIIILGSNGMLGRALVKEGLLRDKNIIATTRTEVDVTDIDSLEQYIKRIQPDIVINTCAIINHTLCDENVKLAYETNARPSAILSDLATQYNFKYVYISTDGYFNGDGIQKHNENAPVSFLNEYARTKFSGEMFALTNSNSLVIRTNIVGFKGIKENPTFIEWVINSFNKNEHITMFDDYFTSSISVSQFSRCLFDILEKDVSGIINLANAQVFSKKQFIEAVAEVFNFSLDNTSVGKVSSLSSKRANSLGLDVSKAESILGYKLPTLQEVILQLKKDYQNV